MVLFYDFRFSLRSGWQVLLFNVLQFLKAIYIFVFLFLYRQTFCIALNEMIDLNNNTINCF